jgi:hypothetical protein
MASPAPIDIGDGSGQDSTTNPEPAQKRDLMDLSHLEPPQLHDVVPDYSYLFSNNRLNRRQNMTMQDDTDPVETIGPTQQIAIEDRCDGFTTSSLTAAAATTSTTSASTMTTTSGWDDQPTFTRKPHHPHHTGWPGDVEEDSDDEKLQESGGEYPEEEQDGEE